jgi:3',5'-cyclic AMP phosphodiesterase CpdA
VTAGGKDVSIVHLSDVHFGRDADLVQLEQIEDYVPGLKPDAIAISGDLTQRARHGEFMAAHAFIRRLARVAPVLVVPGNHDVQWWASPFGLRGTAALYRKYRRYFGDDLGPVLEVSGAVIVGLVTAYGVTGGSMTLNPNDIAVKGHLPKSETDRAHEIFARAPASAVRIIVMHHNVIPGKISGRHGLANWRQAHRRLQETGADVVLCGHDHQEGAGQVAGIYGNGISIYAPSTDYGFKIQTQDLETWLANSPSITNAKKLTKPNKTAYLFHVPNKNRIGILVISNDTDPKWKSIDIQRIDLIKKTTNPQAQWYTTKNAQKTLNQMPDNNTAWLMEN